MNEHEEKKESKIPVILFTLFTVFILFFSVRYHWTRFNDPKLTETQVLEIRSRYIPRTVSMRTLAKEYGVSQPVICRIINRKLWKHLEMIADDTGLPVEMLGSNSKKRRLL